MNLPNRKRLTDTEKNLWLPKGMVVGALTLVNPEKNLKPFVQ